MMNPNITKKGCYYGAWKTEYNDFIIECGGVMCYLLIGKDKAMLIDTAYGKGDLLFFIRTLTDLPLIVVNTHGHGDHSGGDGFFKEVWIAKDGIKEATNKEITKNKLPYTNNIDWHFLEDGMKFDLGGGKIIEAISIAAHHISSFAFLDYKCKNLYTGDEIEPAQVLLFCSGSNESGIEHAAKHLKNMLKLKDRISEFERMYPGHNGTAISTDYIDYYIDLSNSYISGELKPEETVAGYAWPGFIFGGDKKLCRIKKGLVSFIVKK